MRYILRTNNVTNRYISGVRENTPKRIYHSATLPFSRKFDTDIYAIGYFYKCVNMVDTIHPENYYICSIIDGEIIEKTPIIAYVRRMKINKLLNR